MVAQNRIEVWRAEKFNMFGPFMKKKERIGRIYERLRAEPRQWRVGELAGMYGVSPLTIRRDLKEMERQNLILRTHGGAIAAGTVADSPYYRRVSSNFELKNMIGHIAAHQVTPGQTILINDGSTCYHLASNLGGRVPLTVYTNSIPMISELSRFEGIKVFILGGEYNPGLFYTVGSLMERMLEMLEFDTVFLGTDGIDCEGRCLSQDAEMARATEVMLRRGRRRILLADHTKLNAGGNIAYGNLENFDLWITTPGIPADTREKFDSMITLMEAEPCPTQ